MKISTNAEDRQGQIVVVEEMPDNIYSIRFVLESLGHRVGSVSCQSDYLDDIQGLGPDLIIVDMLIPAQGGLTVVEELKRSDLKKIPRLAITADAVALSEAELLGAGFDDVLSKPYTVTQLQEMLGKYVGAAGRNDQ
jgi:CheY-like chemotaxis protein